MPEESPRPRFYAPLLIAPEFERTLAFYRDGLGLPFEGQSPYARCTDGTSVLGIIDGHFWAQVNGSDLSVFSGGSVPPSTILSFEVPDVDVLFERLMAMGTRFLAPPTHRRPIGRRNAFLRDPDGRTVELAQRLPP